jgi:hypothetical protein
MFKTIKTWMLAAVATAFFGQAGAAEWTRVAYDDAGADGKQPHLASGGNWTFKKAGEASEAALSCVFGDIEFVYAGLKPQAAYKVKMTFFADEARTMQVKAGSMVLGEAKAENGKTTTSEFTIPAAAYAKGTLSLKLEKLTGPNVVVSEIEILSDDPTALTMPPEPAAAPLPRLSPRPVSVAGIAKPILDLGGTWRFNPAPAADFAMAAKEPGTGWADIQVPGEWAMQGFEVKPGTAAGYRHTFKIPKGWAGQRIKLRANGVYSDSTVWINGQEAGRHKGGFTPFELDVTALVKPGQENTITISALSESVADKLASGSQYACHQLGGIPRDIMLIALPETNLSSIYATTTFDGKFQNATLAIEVEAANDGTAEATGLQAVLELADADGKAVALTPGRIDLGALKAGATLTKAVAIPVAAPLKWDTEHPNLYTLTVKLEANGKTIETLRQKLGFRQIEMRGNQLFVNGLPVKIRGSNHHEVYPTTGRSLPAGISRRDIELFREGNANLLRTCHYPPDEALMEAADELGMFIECEAPFCWAPGDGHRELVCQQTAEMILTYRNHPSVLWWSLANESGWGGHFVASSKLARKIDPSRPQIFNDNGSRSDPKYTDIINFHYPNHGGPAFARKGQAQPVYLGEDSHLNAYNRLELASDPALRDTWGRYTRELWDDLYTTQGALGQSIWSGVDDTFYMKDDQTVGYGTWGPIDGWRRPKPEWWGMKKAYSPIRLIPGWSLGINPDNVITVGIENRYSFTNLNETKIAWRFGKQSGTTTADIPLGGKGAIAIPLKIPALLGDRLELDFYDPRGFIADQFCLTVEINLKNALLALPGSAQALVAVRDQPKCKLAETATEFTIASGKNTLAVNRQTGQLTSANKLAISGPQLMLLPLNSAGETQMTGKTKVWTPFTAPCSGWTCAKTTAKTEAGSVIVTVEGKYDGAEGSYTMTFQPGGDIAIAYDFTITKAVNPRQVGLVFSLPRECESFSWQRNGYWDVYPEDHIARLKGTVKASEGFEATSVGPRTKPNHPWRLDNLPYGNNDFCSTKHNVLSASLHDSKGNGLTVIGEGKQHVRCWRTDTASNILVADYSNGGSERFLRGMASKDDRPLKPGDKITGTVRLENR